MKHCKYCGQNIHEYSTFCPYCMQSQIEKQNAVIPKRKSKKWLYLSAIGIILIAFIAIVVILLNGSHREADDSDISTETTEIATTMLSTTTSTTTQTTHLTTAATISIKTSTTTVTNSETIEITTTTELASNDITYQVGDYITEGKSYSQIQGYGGYENIGGTILTIEEIDDNSITFSIIKYSESGYASDTVSARNITAEIIDNTAEFQFSDMLDGKGNGTITFEQGKIHIQTWADEAASMQTSIIVDEYLTFDDIG